MKDSALAERCRALKLVLSDVDGVMTDGTFLLLADGREGQAFHVRDGLGIVLAHDAGLRTGPVSWLTEVDYIEDRGLPGGAIARWVGLVEGNWEPRQGHNLKGTVEAIEAASGFDADTQERYSVVYEYAPIQFLQLRGGARL